MRVLLGAKAASSYGATLSKQNAAGWQRKEVETPCASVLTGTPPSQEPVQGSEVPDIRRLALCPP